MKETQEILIGYLELLQVPFGKIYKFINSKNIQLYIYLRDKLTYTQRLDLQITLNNIYNGLEKKDDINFNEYCSLNNKQKNHTCKLLFDSTLDSKTGVYAISTIIAMEPKEIAFNYLII